VVTAIRTGAMYVLSDHAWDQMILDRHAAIMAGALGPVDVKGFSR
jgi:hypothetical protein